ncbi:MAG: hypothetical protein V3V55_03530 [Rhodospirillales bacterium]
MLDNQIAETRTGAYGAEVVDALAGIGMAITHPLFLNGVVFRGHDLGMAIFQPVEKYQ